MLTQSCTTYLELLSSAAPIPGGGSAAAFCSTQGVALGMMVANLTLGKPSYFGVQEEIKTLLQTMTKTKESLCQMALEDAKAFAPLALAYKLPKNTEEEKTKKALVLEDALEKACMAPFKIMGLSQEGLFCLQAVSEKGAQLARSDIGVGVQFLKAGLLGAAMSVYANTSLMKNRSLAETYNQQAMAQIAQSEHLANTIYHTIQEVLTCPKSQGQR